MGDVLGTSHDFFQIKAWKLFLGGGVFVSSLVDLFLRVTFLEI